MTTLLRSSLLGLRPWLVGSALTLALSSLAGCSDSDTGGSGTTTTTSDSTSSSGGGGAGGATTGGASTGGATAGGGGAGGATIPPDDPPVLGTEKVGNPQWEPVDFHLFAENAGVDWSNFHTVIAGLLPPPNHKDHPSLGVGPGDPHAAPYDGELALGVAAKGYVEHSVYPQSAGALPNAIFAAWMMVPSAGAPTGSSPDFASGPIIPNTVFPIAVHVDAYFDGALLDGYTYEFEVPPLDAALDPPFDVDGHSHFPMFDAGAFDGLPQTYGTLETRMTMTDVNGDGWKLDITYTAIP